MFCWDWQDISLSWLGYSSIQIFKNRKYFIVLSVREESSGDEYNMKQINYLDAYQVLDTAFERSIGKTLRKRNREEVVISRGGSMGFYWGEAFQGKTKFIELEDRRILLWLGRTSERAGDGSFHSLWYQDVSNSLDRKTAFDNATRCMRIGIDSKTRNGFAVAYERELRPSFTVDEPQDNYCLVELNKFPEGWMHGSRQRSNIPIRKVPQEFEFGRIHPSKKSTGVPLILYSPDVVDYLVKNITA